MMERVDSMSDDPSLGGSSDSGELSPRPTARLEDFLFDPTGGQACTWQPLFACL